MGSEPDTERALLDPPLRDSRRGERVARAVFWPLQILLVLIVIFAYVLYTPLRVDGDSMNNGLLNADRVLYTKSYKVAHRGDVVVFDAGNEDLLKRVVAVEGDTLEIRDDTAIVNGVVEQTPSLVRIAGAGMYSEPIVIPPNEVFLLGDNRPVSYDSRMFGPVPESQIKGRVIFVFAPLNRIHLVR